MTTRTLALVALGVVVAACGPAHRRLAFAPSAPLARAAPVPLPTPSPAPVLIVPPRSSTCLPLDASEAPLLAILETPAQGAPVGFLETITPFAYTSNLAAWEAIYPEGSPARAAILAHERLHAQRQGADPVAWCARYRDDVAFRLAEEELGYGEQIQELAHAHEPVDVESFVTAMTNPFYEGMISVDDARAWVLAVVAADHQP